MKCLGCGSELLSETGNSEIIMQCPKCGWAAATTYMSEIEVDMTHYSIVVEQGNSAEKEVIRLISGLSGMNVFKTRNILTNGGTMIVDYATVIKKIATDLDMVGVRYHIEPEFPY